MAERRFMGQAAVSGPRAFVTISVDDGHPTDLKTAELLEKYGLKATFYVPARNSEREVMPNDQLRQISESFELGGHTVNHVPLPRLAETTARAEIADCKHWLEDITAKPVVSFCYPKGKFNRAVANLVKEAGFLGARTCQFNLHHFPKDPFFWGVTTQAYSHSHMVQMRHAFLELNFSGAWEYWKIYKGERVWQQHFLRAIDYVSEHGGIVHLYMHSWEIDALGQWSVLESAFQALRNFPALTRVTNGDLFRLWGSLRNSLADTALPIAD
jgi:peptidoglycan-N-acetylglucosamine deacetylase